MSIDRRLSAIQFGVNKNFNHAPDINCKLPRSRSMETIFRNAVEKRMSSSSEECIDISDENLNVDIFAENNSCNGSRPQDDQLQPSTSGYNENKQICDQQMDTSLPIQQHHELSVAEKTEQMILEAEAAKAKIYPNTPGKDFRFIVQMDEDYLVIGGHVDGAMQMKIVNSEYVDFGKLLPKDHIATEEDIGLELVIKNGKTFWMPVADTGAINGFSKWEQAFRVFSNIYARAHPHRSSELIQYNHIIHSIASQYIWENVYSYDKEFRLHLSKHPERSWAIILQQAWTMKLRDRIPRDGYAGNNSYHGGGHHGKSGQHNPGSGGGAHFKSKSAEPCRRFNRGKCNLGSACAYDHRCAYAPCNKFGHSILNCRKLMADKERNKGTGNQGPGPVAGTSDAKN